MAFGLFSVTAMLVCYPLEDRGHWFVLAFAAACAMGRFTAFFKARGRLDWAIQDCIAEMRVVLF